MTSVLEVKGASKSFGEVQALAGASLALHQGEWLALLGPNGAGKTTLVRSIAGRVRLDGGDTILLGEKLDSSGNTRSRLGIVPQEVALFPLLTASENLRAWGTLCGVAAADLEERIEWALDWTALGDRRSEPVDGFSGGMKRRLNLACGVLHRPLVVLLDEPTAGVDPQSRERIWEMLEQLRGAGASLLLTTHQLDEAQQVADRIAIIDQGRVIEEGSFSDLLERTVGAERKVRFTLASSSSGNAPERDHIPQEFDRLEDGRLELGVESVTQELEHSLRRLREAGYEVADLEIEVPSLQQVFLHLTGRELRE